MLRCVAVKRLFLVAGVLAAGCTPVADGPTGGPATAAAATAAAPGAASAAIAAAPGSAAGAAAGAPGSAAAVTGLHPELGDETAPPPEAAASTAKEVPGQPGLFVVRRRLMAMTTHWEVALATRDAASAEAPIAECFAEIARLENVLSEWKPETEISKVNAAAGVAPVKVSPELLDTLQVALDVGAMTEGGFDITFLPIGRLWHLRDPHAKLPDPAELAKAISLVGYRHVVLDRAKSTAYLDRPGMAIGLGGIGQGIAVDRCSAILRARGFPDFIVDGSGDLFVSGKKGTEGWKVGVAHPRVHGWQFARLSLENRAITTAGDYERFAVIDGVHYHHIIDPKTGYPVPHTASVSVIAPTTVLADALDTGLFVMGAEKGLAVVAKRPDLEALFVSADGTVQMTPGFAKLATVDALKLDLSVWR